MSAGGYFDAEAERLRSRRPWYLIGLALLILSIILREPLIFAGALFSFGLGVIPELWYRFCFSGLVYRRQFEERRAFFGEPVTLRVVVENRKFLPLPWLEVEDEMPQKLTLHGGTLGPHFKPGRQTFINVFSLWWYQRVARRYQVSAVARGVHRLGPALLRSGDPFGLLNREENREQTDMLLVYPPILPIERFGLPARHPFGERAAPRLLLEDPLRVVGVREWQAGDGLRRVHWKATARSMTLQSKVYEPTTTYALALFLNVNAYGKWVAGTNAPLLELLISAAASVAAWANEQGYAVGLFSNGVQVSIEGVEEGEEPAAATLQERVAESLAASRVRLPPSSQREQLARVLEALARLVPYFGSPMERLLNTEQPRLPAGATIVLASAAQAISPEEIALLRQARARGHTVALLLAGNGPVEAPGIPTYRLGNEETWHEIVAQATSRDHSPAAQTPEAGQRFLLA
jgi:uncharacterized protein (DUF58 family)